MSSERHRLVISLTSATGSHAAASTASVAPKCRARSSFELVMSTAMMRPAPAIAAPLIADRPTPPQPITATVLPDFDFAQC